MGRKPRTTRPSKAKETKVALTFNLDERILRQLRDRSVSTGLTPGLIVQAALTHVFVRHKHHDWLPAGPSAAMKKARTLRQSPPKSFRWIGAYLERNGYVTSEGSDKWPGSSVQYYLRNGTRCG